MALLELILEKHIAFAGILYLEITLGSISTKEGFGENVERVEENFTTKTGMKKTIESCANCKFWFHSDRTDLLMRRGICRRYPPKPEEESDLYTAVTWWCGEWKGKRK